MSRQHSISGLVSLLGLVGACFAPSPGDPLGDGATDEGSTQGGHEESGGTTNAQPGDGSATTSSPSTSGADVTSDSTGEGEAEAESSGGDEPDHVVFVTSATTRGNLMGLSGADAQCEFLAMIAGLDGGRKWVALLSDSEAHVNTRVTISGPVRNVAGDMIAPTAVSFWDQDMGAQLLDEFGDLPPSWDPEENWAVTWAATPTFSCQDWTNASLASAGDIAVTLPGLWIFGGGADRGCNSELPYICISQ